jgi:hypothetical protein
MSEALISTGPIAGSPPTKKSNGSRSGGDEPPEEVVTVGGVQKHREDAR